MESQPQNPEFRMNPENFHPCHKRLTDANPRGGTLVFSAYVGSDPASTVHPQKISGISNTPKKYLKFLATQKYIPILNLDLKKRA